MRLFVAREFLERFYCEMFAGCRLCMCPEQILVYRVRKITLVEAFDSKEYGALSIDSISNNEKYFIVSDCKLT